MTKKPVSPRPKLHQTPNRPKEVDLKKYRLLYSCRGLLGVYKNVNHRLSCAVFKLCNDIETNPGPTIPQVNSI